MTLAGIIIELISNRNVSHFSIKELHLGFQMIVIQDKNILYRAVTSLNSVHKCQL